MKNFLLLLLLVSLFGCKMDSEKAIDRGKFTFKTGDDTELFFKNIRQSSYELEENQAAKLNIFRIEKRSKSTDHPVINLAIVMSYLKDEAYLLIEPNAYLENVDQLMIHATFKNEVGNLVEKDVILEQFHKENMLEFASQLYELLLMNASFTIETGSSKEPILQDQKEREAFRITVSDYYRLTRIY